jgi:hypothetical protein
METSI